MYLVAIAELKGEPDGAELGALAKEIGTTAYELRLVLNGGLPAIVSVTVDVSQARAVATAIARHKHVPAFCDQSLVVPSSRMTMLRHFALDKTQLVADRAAPESCRYEDLAMMLRATQRTSRSNTEKVTDRKIQPVMALATGGLVLSKKVTKEVVTTTSEREQVLYLFRRGEPHPWILRERAADYAALAGAMAAASFQNFTTTIAQLRKSAPQAIYDERLVNCRPIRGIGDGSDATDIYAYLLADYFAPSQ